MNRARVRSKRWLIIVSLSIIIFIIKCISDLAAMGCLSYLGTFEDVGQKYEQIDSFGYQVEQNFYTNILEDGDARFQLPLIEDYVGNLQIKFSEPIPQDMTVEVYYSSTDMSYSQDMCKSVILEKYSEYVDITLNQEVANIRVDISNQCGDEFYLDYISINDVVMYDIIGDIVVQNIIFVVILAFIIIVLIGMKKVCEKFHHNTEKIVLTIVIALLILTYAYWGI